MKKRISALLFVVAALLLSAAVFAAEEAAPAAAPAPAPEATPAPAAKKVVLVVGNKIDKISLKDAEEADTVLDVQKGVTAITFFNTMCSACRQELSLLESLKKQKKDLVVAAISVDVDGAKTLAPFRAKNPYTFTYFLDPNFKTAEMFGIPYTPGLVIVKDGEIAYIKGGFVNAYADEIIKVVLK